MYSLDLAVNDEGWRLYMKRKADPAFFRIRDRVFERDQYSCQFCGFQAKEYQEIVNLDQDYFNNKISNMVTACCFCAQCFFIQEVGQSGFGGGKLIYLPELAQQELNAFCHVLFCAITNGTSYRDTAQTIYRNLKFRSQPIEDKYGLGTSNPNTFGRILMEYEDKDKDKDNKEPVEKKVLGDFRLLPSYAKFKKQLEIWAASAAKELSEPQ